MTISCKEVSRLVSEGLDKELTADEQLRLRAHLAICRGCRSLADRMAFLGRAIKKIVDIGNNGDS